MPLIYLRHGDDRNDDIYRHDRPLTPRGKKKAEKCAKRLIEKYGHPDAVYVSPFRRTLETLTALSTRFTRPVSVHRDPRIAQYLSERQQRAPSLSPETAAQITILEDVSAFRHRVHAHVEELRRASGVLWCVTHQAVIDVVADHLDVKISGSLDFLDHLVVLR